MPEFAQTLLFYGPPFLIVITVIVTVHELGHFLVARACGVAVAQFSIGFGHAILSWKDRSGVQWRVGWLPLGGYVKFAGDTNVASVPDQTDLETMRADIVSREGAGAEQKYLSFKPLWQRTLVVLAGPAANFLLAAVLFSLFISIFGHPVVSTRVAQITPGGGAAVAGFQVGDRVISADGHRLSGFSDMQLYVRVRANVPINFVVDRQGHQINLNATPHASVEADPSGGKQVVGLLGLASADGKIVYPNPLESVGLGVKTTWDVTQATGFFLGQIVTGKVSPNQLHGFIGIARASGSLTKGAVESARAEHVNWFIAVSFVLIQMTGLLSISVGMLNLLPIPVLDGGHLVFYAYEAVARRPMATSVQAVGYRVGLALLLGLMLFSNWNDLWHLPLFHRFGG